MSPSPRQQWQGWQTLTLPRARAPRVGDAILTRVHGTVSTGTIAGLLEGLDDAPVEGVWVPAPEEPQPQEINDAQAEAEPASETQAAAASSPERTRAAQAG